MDRIAEWLENRYLLLDRRVLGLFRIGFGCLLLGDVLRRMAVATFFFSNDGFLSNHVALARPLAKPFYFSLYNAFSTPFEVKLAFGLTAIAFCFYIVGYHTKLFQIIAFVLATSLNSRNLLLENGGTVVVCLVAMWSMFMPLGDRFSVDALLRSFRECSGSDPPALNRRRWQDRLQRPAVSFVALAVACQIAVIYLFNVIHKTGETWTSLQAVHWVLWQNRIATHLAEFIRMHEPAWFSPMLVIFTFVAEGAAPFFVLTPVLQKYTRTISFLLLTALHLGIAAMTTLGPFSYVMVLLNFLLLPKELFSGLAGWLARRRPEIDVYYDSGSQASSLVARWLARLDALRRIEFHEIDEANRDPQIAGVGFCVRTRGQSQVEQAGLRSACEGLALPRIARLCFSLALPPGFWHQEHARDKAWARWGFGRYGVRTGAPPPRRFLGAWMRETAVLFMMVAMTVQTSRQNPAIPESWRLPQPALLSMVSYYPRLMQRWSLFAPDAPRSDALVVIDAVTRSGTRLDPLTGEAPDFDAPLHGPWFHSQFWCDFHNRIQKKKNEPYRRDFVRYLKNWHEIENRPASDQLVSYKVYSVTNASPAYGSTEPYYIQRSLLFEWGEE